MITAVYIYIYIWNMYVYIYTLLIWKWPGPLRSLGLAWHSPVLPPRAVKHCQGFVLLIFSIPLLLIGCLMGPECVHFKHNSHLFMKYFEIFMIVCIFINDLQLIEIFKVSHNISHVKWLPRLEVQTKSCSYYNWGQILQGIFILLIGIWCPYFFHHVDHNSLQHTQQSLWGFEV